MFTKAEIITSLVSGAGVVGVSVMATTFLAGGGGAGNLATVAEARGESRHLYELSDAFFTCRDQAAKAVPYKVRNVNIDSHSSRYQADSNTNMVFMSLEVIEKPGSFYSKSNYEATILCQVSAANNEVTRFRITRG